MIYPWENIKQTTTTTIKRQRSVYTRGKNCEMENFRTIEAEAKIKRKKKKKEKRKKSV